MVSSDERGLWLTADDVQRGRERRPAARAYVLNTPTSGREDGIVPSPGSLSPTAALFCGRLRKRTHAAAGRAGRREQVRFVSASQFGAGAFLTAIPARAHCRLPHCVL